MLVFQVLGHVAAHDALCQTFDDGRLTRARFTYQYRIVLRAAREDLKHAANLVVTTDDRIQLARARILHQVLRVLRQTLVVLVAALALYAAALTQGPDGLHRVVAVQSGILQDARGRGVHFQQRQQQRLHADKLVAHLLRHVHGAHQHVVRLAAQVGFAALNARQMLYLGVHERLHVNAVHAQFLEYERCHVLAFLEHTLQQVHRFDDLLPVSSRLLHGLLYSFLRLNGKILKCHIVSPFFVFLFRRPASCRRTDR